METVVAESREGPGRAAPIVALFEALCAANWSAAAACFAPDAVTEYPQSGERFRGPAACVEAFAEYPGGSPALALEQISGEGRHWTLELIVDYATRERWRAVDVLELDGTGRIQRSVALLRATVHRPGLAGPPARHRGRAVMNGVERPARAEHSGSATEADRFVAGVFAEFALP